MKLFIAGSCDIGCLCSNMRIEDNEAVYDMALKNHEFETKGERREQKSKFVPHLRRA